MIGPAESSREEARAAEQAGRCLAKSGAILLCGGLSGVMEAACRGAREESGSTVGILPGLAGENPHLTVVIRSGLGHARNVVLVQSSDAVVAIGGGLGTLSEIAIALKSGLEVAGYGTWDIPGVTPFASPEEAVRGACASAARRRMCRSPQDAPELP